MQTISVKQEVNYILDRLPDNCSVDDVQYHLYVLQKIENGLKDSENGNVYTHEEMEERLSKWIRK